MVEFGEEQCAGLSRGLDSHFQVGIHSLPVPPASIMPEVWGAAQARLIEASPGVVRLAVAHPAVAFDAHLEVAVGPSGRTRVGVIAQAILGPEFPVNAI